MVLYILENVPDLRVLYLGAPPVLFSGYGNLECWDLIYFFRRGGGGILEYPDP
jgi:hypothetical protein